MKHLKSIIAVALLSLTACAGDESEPIIPELVINSRNIEGVWKLESIDNTTLDDEQYLYIEFERENLTYDMYENFDSKYSTQTVGEFFISKDEDSRTYIDGNYSANFGEKWGEHYYIEDFTLETMAWRGAASGEVQRFLRVEQIPEDIVAGTRSRI